MKSGWNWCYSSAVTHVTFTMTYSREQSFSWVQALNSFWARSEIQYENVNILLKYYSILSPKCSESYFNKLQPTPCTGDWLEPRFMTAAAVPGPSSRFWLYQWKFPNNSSEVLWICVTVTQSVKEMSGKKRLTISWLFFHSPLHCSVLQSDNSIGLLFAFFLHTHLSFATHIIIFTVILTRVAMQNSPNAAGLSV